MDAEKPFAVDRAKIGRASCKHCKQKCEKGELRLAKLVPSPYGEGKMKSWFHLTCIFEQFLKQRATTKRLEHSDELEGWVELNKDDQEAIAQKWEEYEKLICEKYHLDFKGEKFTRNKAVVIATSTDASSPKNAKENKDGLFREFRRLVADITNVSSYTEKTNIVNALFTKKEGFKSDVTLWCRLLLPGVAKRIYNLQSRQLVKLFSKIFRADQSDMLEHLEQGDIGETIQHFFEESRGCKPAKKSTVTMLEVDNFLEHLAKLTREDDQIDHFTSFAAKCTTNDLKTVIRLIKHDLRMNAGAKHILDAVHPEAYESYQSTRDLATVIERCLNSKDKKDKVNTGIQVLTPVLPMLAEPCKSIEQAMKKCPHGMYSEIKYDGERVQLHKKGSEFKFFSRSLKPVMQHKIVHFKEYIPKAFPHGKDLVLDSEILMVDTNTGKPLPFGTLGVHKREGFEHAAVCLFVFDCIYFNGEVLTEQPLETRKRILQANMTPIAHRIVFSEMKRITAPAQLATMITHVLRMGLEGLVLKDVRSTYEPGKRHWLKVKKDYLFDGAIADSADLLVLGAWYGTGKKGGIMSVFLMGVHDPRTDRFVTVTKVHTGHDDRTLARLQDELRMVKIGGEVARVPTWLRCTRTMVPDFVAEDPRAQPVWEVTGAEFTRQHDVHTANGISIRFPRVTRIRDDKDWTNATSLDQLERLFATSKETFDGSLFDDELKALSANALITDYVDDQGVLSTKQDRKHTGDAEDHEAEGESKDIESLGRPTDPEEDLEAEEIAPKVRRGNGIRKAIIENEEDQMGSTEETISKSPEQRRKRKSNDVLDSPKKEEEKLSFVSTRKNRKASPKSPKQAVNTEEHESAKKHSPTSTENIQTTNPKPVAKRPKLEFVNPLPSYFEGVNLLLADESIQKKHEYLLRSFIAYSGVLLERINHQQATHVLHDVTEIKFAQRFDVKCPNTVYHVTVNWVHNSILSAQMLHVAPYLVKLIPQHKSDVAGD